MHQRPLRDSLLVVGGCLLVVFALLANANDQTTDKSEAKITFTTAFVEVAGNTDKKSLQSLLETSPLFPPLEGLPEEYWKNDICSNCHNWSPADLCNQGKFYMEKTFEKANRIAHPYGGAFKQALVRWANDGCL